MLLDVGADDAKTCRLVNGHGGFNLGTPLEYTAALLTNKELQGEPATEDQLHRLAAIRRLLLRVDGVRAASSLWSRKPPFIAHVVGEAKGKGRMNTSYPLGVLIVRRRPGVRAVLLTSIYLQVNKFLGTLVHRPQGCIDLYAFSVYTVSRYLFRGR